MKSFLKQYGVGIFVLILVSILISFTSPLGNLNVSSKKIVLSSHGFG